MAARQAGGKYNFSIKYSVKIAEASCLLRRPWCFASIYPDYSCQFDLS